MTITLLPEQERLLRKVIDSGLAKSPEEALTRALELLKEQLPASTDASNSLPKVTERLARFGTDNQTIKDLLNASRP
jgi:hypothetical protein